MIATQGHIPDMTILLDLDPSQVHPRTDVSNDQSGLREDQTRFDKEAQEFHHKVRDAFLVLARLYPERSKLLDTSRPHDEIHNDMLALLKTVLYPRSELIHVS